MMNLIVSVYIFREKKKNFFFPLSHNILFFSNRIKERLFLKALELRRLVHGLINQCPWLTDTFIVETLTACRVNTG